MWVTVGERDAVEAEPDEALDELMDGEEGGERGEEKLAAVLYFGQRDDADGSENAAADEVCCCGKTHVASLFAIACWRCPIIRLLGGEVSACLMIGGQEWHTWRVLYCGRWLMAG